MGYSRDERIGLKLLRHLFFFNLSFLLCSFANAYPEFIGYGYSSCLTCHYNGQGGGSLTEYGRALWSAEIASRAFSNSKDSDEDIAKSSGFLGATPLPWWVHPYANYSGMWLRQQPGGSNDKVKYYQMQAAIGADFQVSREGDTIFQMAFENIPSQAQATTNDLRMLPSDYFVRTKVSENYWLYAGLIEKVFGLRNIDHSSYQRRYQGFNPVANTNLSHSQSLILHKLEEKWEAAIDVFFGNPAEDDNLQHRGASAMSEFEVGENKRLGGSLSSSKNQIEKKDMAAVHYRQAISHGSALLLEYGLIQNTDLIKNNLQTGSYNLIQGLILLTRGYHLKATSERYNSDFNSRSPDLWKWSMGLLVFPAPRFEFRAEVINTRQSSAQQATDDSWALLGQFHVSL